MIRSSFNVVRRGQSGTADPLARSSTCCRYSTCRPPSNPPQRARLPLARPPIATPSDSMSASMSPFVTPPTRSPRPARVDTPPVTQPHRPRRRCIATVFVRIGYDAAHNPKLSVGHATAPLSARASGERRAKRMPPAVCDKRLGYLVRERQALIRLHVLPAHSHPLDRHRGEQVPSQHGKRRNRGFSCHASTGSQR